MAETMATAALLRLVTWLSPAFPIGAFAYSGGLEQAVRDEHVADAADLSVWLSTVIGHGSLWNEAVLFAEAYRSFDDPVALDEVMELAEALAGLSSISVMNIARKFRPSCLRQSNCPAVGM